MAETPDPLCSDSLPNRIERFKFRMAESPVDRACQHLADAINDLNDALWLSGTPEAMAQVMALANDSIDKLATTITVAMARQEHHL